MGLTTLAASTYFFNYLNKNNFKIHPNVANLYTHVPLYFIGLYGVQFGLKAFRSQSTNSVSSLLIPSASYLAGTALLGYTLSAFLQKPTIEKTTSAFSKKEWSQKVKLFLFNLAIEKLNSDNKIAPQERMRLLIDAHWEKGELSRQSPLQHNALSQRIPFMTTQKIEVLND